MLLVIYIVGTVLFYARVLFYFIDVPLFILSVIHGQKFSNCLFKILRNIYLLIIHIIQHCSLYGVMSDPE